MSAATDVRTLQLGEHLALPVDAVTRTVAIVGQKGTGKTSTGVVLTEEAAAAGARFAVMDPTGAWSGLRASADGDGPGLDCVVMGGFHGDVPLDHGAGEVVARLVVEEGYSIVCDLERMTRSQQVAFVADFSAAALELCRSAVTVIFDEAPRFVPQGGAGIEEDGIRCRVAVTEVVMLGRRKGLGSVLITQRPGKLHKDVLEQSDVMVAHRLMGNNDRKAIAGWLEEYGEEADGWMGRLPKLQRGEAVVLAPEYDVGGVFQVRAKRTFDSSATPDVGAVLLDAPRGRASIDLSDLEAKMGHALAQAQENDPEALRQRIYRLEAQLADAAADARDGGEAREDFEAIQAHCNLTQSELDDLAALVGLPPDGDHGLVRDRVGALMAERRGFAARLAEIQGEARRLAQQADQHFSTLTEARRDFEEGDAARARAAPPDAEGVQSTAAPERPSAQAPADEGTGRTAVDGGRGRSLGGESDPSSARAATEHGPGSDLPAIKAGAVRMLAALLDAPRPLSRDELATLAVVGKGGTMSDYLSTLRRRGLIVEDGGRIGLHTDRAAARLVGREAQPRTPEQVVEPHLRSLKAGARRMLGLLMRAPDEGYTRKELSGLGGVSAGGTLSDYLSSLRRRGLIEERNRRVYPGSVLYLWEQPQ